MARISQRYKRKWYKNLLSGHEWPEDTLFNIWDIHSTSGIVATTKSFPKAIKLAAEWQAFEDKFNLRVP